MAKAHRKRAAAARRRLEETADRIFFEHLWERVAAMVGDEAAETRARRRFKTALVEAARRELIMAFGSIPCPSIHAPRAEVRARGRLEGLLRHHGLIEEAEHV